MSTGALDRVVRREPLGADGKSGAALERAWLDDGTAVVLKHADARQDWIMQATGDTGRIAGLWDRGVFDRMPGAIDHATLDVERAPGGAVVVMRDVTPALFGARTPSTPELRAVLAAAAQLHDAFAGEPLSDMCSLASYYTFLSPDVCARFAPDHVVPRLALDGWARFHEIVAPDVGAAVDAVHRDPGRLAAALLDRPSTLVHGDLKLANLGITNGRPVVLDWGTLSTWAPPAVDHAWFLAINTAALGTGHEAVLAEIRQAQGGAYDSVAESLALLGALAQLGWEKALGATSDDPSTRDRERAGLAWWIERVRPATRLI